jgi:divalent metal cation (Fe/Co/Zn/Cd) transporter
MPLPLIEKSVKDITRTLKRHIELIKGVEACHHLNVRITGKRCDVELLIDIDSKLDSESFRKVSFDVEQQIKRDLPNARVIIHSEPKIHDKESAWILVKGIAEEAPGSRGVHNIHIQKIEGK